MTTLILSVFFSISSSAYDVEVDGIFYNVVEKALVAEVTSGDISYTGEIIIPESITFKDTEIRVSGIGKEAFYCCYFLRSVIIPNSVSSIGDNAFYCCYNLTSVTIPNSVTSIGDNAFSDCNALRSVIISNSVSSIGDNAFSGCYNLTSVTIPNSVTSIGRGTFSGCSGLTSVTIPNSVTSIESNALSNCKNLKNVYCFAEKVPSTESDAFVGAYIEYATLHVPASAIDAYKTTEPWSAFGTFKTLEGTEVETKKCETPTISFVDGKLTFSCATEGAEYVSEVTCSDVNKYYSNEINLAACYDITVTAMKTGYYNSDVATAKLYWLTSSGTLEGAGINNVSMRGIAIQSAGGFVTISGLDNNETVSFYGIDGKSLGSATAINGTTSFAAQSGSIVVAKIGKENIKIAVK